MIHYDLLVFCHSCVLCVCSCFFLRCNYKGWPHDHSHSFLRCGVLAETQNFVRGSQSGGIVGKAVVTGIHCRCFVKRVSPRSTHPRFLRSWKWLAANGFSSRGRGIFTSPLSILGFLSSQVIFFWVRSCKICWKRYPFLKVGLKFFFWSWIIWIFIRYFIHIHGCFRK